MHSSNKFQNKTQSRMLSGKSDKSKGAAMTSMNGYNTTGITN
jgi:hypothetical protein